MFFKPVYILILAFTIIIDYWAGILIEKEENTKKKKYLLIVSLISNIGVLAIFKYYNFLNENITSIANLFHLENNIPYLSILLPIGLSFHTFQAMSYTIEVYYGNQKAEKHFGIYSLYVMFYPQLVAGPIERPQNILHQFHEKKYFDFENAKIGLNLIAIGLFKKIVVADRLSIYVNSVYSDLQNANSLSTIIACCFFSVQIYCDFSGYSDIARGTAKFMGFDLMVNFNNPYSSKSIAEFWSKWHISLSTWFRDYVYIPLGGNRVKKWKWIRNLTIVFLLSGLWHGASWNFIIWGALHAFYLIVGILLTSILGESSTAKTFIGKFVNQFIVFLLVTFAWIFFRAENFQQAMAVIKNILDFNFTFNITQLSAEKGPLNLILSFFSIFLLITISMPKNVNNNYKMLSFLLLITFLILILGKNETAEFIYFQF
jgi:D-alanyl-lipoteichoic acid acyltransferase DltB (MBOAT superfamily)